MGKTETVITRISGEAEAKSKLDNLEYLKQWGFSATNCAMCGISNSQLSGVGLLQCARCRKAHYCGVQCLQKDFQDHIQVCGLIDIGTCPRPPVGGAESSVNSIEVDATEPSASKKTGIKKKQEKADRSPSPSKKKKGDANKKKKGKKAPTTKDLGDDPDGHNVSETRTTLQEQSAAEQIFDNSGEADRSSRRHYLDDHDMDNTQEDQEINSPSDVVLAPSTDDEGVDQTPRPGISKLQPQSQESPVGANRPGVGKLPSDCIKCFDTSNDRGNNHAPDRSSRKWQPTAKPTSDESTGESQGNACPKVSPPESHSDELAASQCGDPNKISPNTICDDDKSGGEVCIGDDTETAEEESRDGIGRLDTKRLQCHSPQSSSSKPRSGVGRLPSAFIKCFDNEQGVPNTLSPKTSPRKWKSSKDPRPSGSIERSSPDHKHSGMDDPKSPQRCEHGTPEESSSIHEKTEGEDCFPIAEPISTKKLPDNCSADSSPIPQRRVGKLPSASIDCSKQNEGSTRPRGRNGNTETESFSTGQNPRDQRRNDDGCLGSGGDHRLGAVNGDGAHVDSAESAQLDKQSGNRDGATISDDQDDPKTLPHIDETADAIEGDFQPRNVGKLKGMSSSSPKRSHPRKTGKLPVGSVDAFEDATKGAARIPQGVGKLNPGATNPGRSGATSRKLGTTGKEASNHDEQDEYNMTDDEEECDTSSVDGSCTENVGDATCRPSGVGHLTGMPTASSDSPRRRKTGKLPHGCIDAFEESNSKLSRSRHRHQPKDLDNNVDISNPRSLRGQEYADIPHTPDDPTTSNACEVASGCTGPEGMDDHHEPLNGGEDCERRSIGKLKAPEEDRVAAYSPKTRSVGKLPMANIGCFEKDDPKRAPRKLGATSFASSPSGSNYHHGKGVPRNPLSPQPPSPSVSPTRAHMSPKKLPSGATECFDSPRRHGQSPRRLKSADHLPSAAIDCFEHPAPSPVRRPVRSSPGKLKSFAIRAFAPRTPSQDNLPPAFASLTKTTTKPTTPRRKWVPPKHRQPEPEAGENNEEVLE